jgi:hypothetical protein
VWVERERGRGSWAEGANERGEVGKQGAGARTWPKNARPWARPHRGDRGREVRDGLTGGDGGTERERELARVRETTPIARPHGAARERGERARSGWRRQAGPACQTKRGARARGPTWAELVFSIFLEFLLPFLFIFCRVFNSNSIQVSNSNHIKYVQQFKEYLGSI